MNASTNVVDFAIIGAGIAGASIASELAQHGSVLLIEMESHAGYHSTGRSAAMYIPSYGPLTIQALTRASGEFFANPPAAFGSAPLLTPRSELMIAREDQLQELDAFYDECTDQDQLSKLNARQVQSHCPILKPGYAAAGVLDTSGSEINVHALHHGFLKLNKMRGGIEVMNEKVVSLDQKKGLWHINTATEKYQSKVVINAAGAWADEIGKLANAESIGLIPKRRTALTIEVPEIPNFNSIPLVADINEAFYIKPDAGNLLISPANEDPMPPCDVQPTELDIALCIDQIETAFNLDVQKVISQWAGLRSFVTDKSPVVGYASQAQNFFWLAGQGGYGIQSSPAMARHACAIALGNSIPTDILKQGLKPNDVSIERFSE